jgi:hypothetical protein
MSTVPTAPTSIGTPEILSQIEISTPTESPELVAQLKAAAQDALDRGFAILTVQPGKKDPWAKYSIHAVNSATWDSDIALRPWTDGHAANYGISGGKSNLAIVDCDHGLADEEALYAWMKKNNLPETFIVRSGRDPEAGFHLYYSGAVPTCGFQIDGVTGEIKSIGGYVVGPGSIHPSGKPYTIVKDVPIAPLPESLITLAAEKQNKLDFKPAAETGKLIPEGNRWAHLQSKAGTFRNAGLSRDGIYNALKDFAANQCEDGENYPDEKIQALADAAVAVFEPMEQTGIVIVGEDKPVDMGVRTTPDDAVFGDWIGDLAHELSDGTFIPPEFVRAQVKTILGASLDGLVGFPGQDDLHTRQWTMLISTHPDSGKGESWKRTGDNWLKEYIAKTSLGLPKAGWFSSGEHVVKKLVDFEGKNCVVNFDEMKTVFDKGTAQGSTLINSLNELYEKTNASSGSLTHKGGSFENVSLSWVGGFTRSGFEQSLSGKNAGGTGFMSRCCLVYADKKHHVGDWKELDVEIITTITDKMLKRYSDIFAEHSKQNDQPTGLVVKKPWRFTPSETEEAKALRIEFEKYIASQSKGSDDPRTERLFSHFKRDVLLRTIFSDDPTMITAEATQRSITWAKHELYLRRELWAMDQGNSVEKMEQAMKKALMWREDDPPNFVRNLSRARLKDVCHVHRPGSGGEEAFLRAWKSVTSGGDDAAIVRLGNSGLGGKKQRWALNEGVK